MIAQICPTYTTFCSLCSTSIPAGAIRITKSSHKIIHYFHLNCIKPDQLVPLKFSDFLIKRLDESQIAAIQARIEAWNSQFVISEKRVPKSFLHKSVPTVCTRARRLLVETFAYLTIKQIETSIALVSKEWFHVSRDPELWRSLYSSVFHVDSTESDPQFRRKYIAAHLNSCWRCKKPIDISSIARKFSQHNRPMCKGCARLPECRIVSIYAIMNYKNVQHATMQYLQLPEFEHRNVKSCYIYYVLEKIVPYAERRRKLLIETLKNRYWDIVLSSEIAEIEEIDLGKFFVKEASGYSVVTKAQREATVFFGKCEKNEDLEKSVRVFLREIEKKRMADG